MQPANLQEQMVRLASYLRQNPGAASLSAAELANVVGVDETVVERALTHAPYEVSSPSRPATPGRFRETILEFRRKLADWESKVLPIIAISTLIMVVAIGILGAMTFRLGRESFGFLATLTVQVILGMTVFALHMLIYFRYARARHPLWGFLIFWGMTAIGASLAVSANSSEDMPPALAAAAMTFVTGILSTFYLGSGLAFALLGAYWRLRRNERLVREQTRQEMIERLFEIEAALEEGPRAPWIPDATWVRRLKGLVFPIGFWLGFVLSAIFLLSASFVEMPDSTRDRIPGMGFMLVFLGLGSLIVVVHGAVAYLGGNPLRSIVVSVLYSIGGQASQWLIYWLAWSRGLQVYLSGPLSRSFEASNAVSSMIIAVFVGLFAGLGALVQERTVTERRRRNNDPEVLLAEYVSIQRKLNPASSIKCVAVFDAAKSSQMKANSSPLVAEWSFRAYQEFLSAIVEAHAGTIHSTAGDGAVAVFGDCPSALRAAKEVLSRLPRFNQEVNRLKDPFRLRIGLHCDQVAGNLTEVQFAAVIDIAAHTEAASQVGGICITEPVRLLVPEERVAELTELIDGYKAFVVLETNLE